MIQLAPIVSRSKNESYKSQKIKKFALNSLLQTTDCSSFDKNDVQMLILCLPYSISLLLYVCKPLSRNSQPFENKLVMK